jgi:hypothetical protein
MYDFFNDTVNSDDYIAQNDRIINKYLILMDVEGNGRGLICDRIPAYAWRY